MMFETSPDARVRTANARAHAARGEALAAMMRGLLGRR